MSTVRTRWRRADLAVAGAGILVLLTSFVPWYRSGWAVGGLADGTFESDTANAWTASTPWTVSVMCALAAAVGWLFFVRHTAHRLSTKTWVLWIPPALAVTALALLILRWATIVPLERVDGGSQSWLWSTGDGSNEFGEIVRDELYVYHAPGRDLDVAWGVHLGLASMALLSVSSLLAAARASSNFARMGSARVMGGPTEAG